MKGKKIYFITGSQHLYGEETLKQVAQNSKDIVAHLNYAGAPFDIVWKETVKTPGEITDMMKAVNADDSCVGIITWMHTFSPAKMWINGLAILNKPILHLHTQANEKIPYDSIDMDFMNLNQAAHGDREFGHIVTKMKIPRKVVAGFYKDPEVSDSIFVWMRAAAALDFSKSLKIARFGDNMREVAVTDGDKVAAQIKLGWSVNGYGIGDFVDWANRVTEEEADALLIEYKNLYGFATDDIAAVREQAKYEIALERFLTSGSFGAVTTTFEDLHGLKQLPGLAIQRIMGKGFGFGGEGDWKTSALLAVMKYMASGLAGGTSFMEDYTYHMEKGKELVLGAHMLEVCPTLAADAVRINVKPLGIGGKEPPARLTFHAKAGKAVNATLVDLGNRFRLIVNIIEIVDGTDMPNLPVAQVLWRAEPSLQVSATAWIYAGGAHHTVLSTQLTLEHLLDFAEMCGIECVIIDKNTELRSFKDRLALSDLLWCK